MSDLRSLLSLATELIQVITNELTTYDIKNLRLTCKQLCGILNATLFRELSINFSRDTFEKDLSKVRTLATTDCHAASSGTRTLKIASLSLGYDPTHPGPPWKQEAGRWVAQPYPKDPPEIAAAEEEMKGYLFHAIASLIGVHSVKWNPCDKDADWAQEAVMDALKTLPNLRVFLLRDTHCKIPLPLHDLSGIQEIYIGDIKHQSEILENIAKLVARSPKATSIEIHWPKYQSLPFYTSQSLHQIFKYYPKSSATLQLRHLSLQACLVKLDGVTLPHLQHLTSLSLLNIYDPYKRRFRWTNEEPSDLDLQLVSDQKEYGSSLDDIWKALKVSRIRLEELVLDVVVPSFLDYLASYSGLKKLQLTADGFTDGDVSDSTAKQFFSTPFTNHVQSLEDLDIMVPYEGSWCFGACNLAVISRCTNLKTLRMAIISDQLSPSESAGGPDPVRLTRTSNVIELFIDTVSNFMPRLETLFISPADLEGHRGAICGMPSDAHFSATERDIIVRILEYEAPLTCQRLPHLTVTADSERIFVSGRPGENGRLRYIDTNPTPYDDHYESD